MAIHQATKSLKARAKPLAEPRFQLEVLNAGTASHDHRSFRQQLMDSGYPELKPVRPEIFQVNVGKLCNQSCAHCHVDAGPDRKEVMSKENLQLCLDIIRTNDFKTVDITGGAPELNPHFRWFVEECSELGVQIIDRCNLTIVVSNPKHHDLPQFLARHNVNVVASLPHFAALRTDHQRGDGVFADSIRALIMLNEVGYGKEGSGLSLDLVHNPSGAYLPADQTGLEAEFKRQLKRKHNIDFNHLLVITNLPISRYLEYLLETGNYETYMQTLIDAFNPATIDNLMCRNTISVSWDGYLYDCDFNQMLDLNVASAANHISNFDLDVFMQRDIVVNQHCYGCTAGAGSSCGGKLVQ